MGCLYNTFWPCWRKIWLLSSRRLLKVHIRYSIGTFGAYNLSCFFECCIMKTRVTKTAWYQWVKGEKCGSEFFPLFQKRMWRKFRRSIHFLCNQWACFLVPLLHFDVPRGTKDIVQIGTSQKSHVFVLVPCFCNSAGELCGLVRFAWIVSNLYICK